MCCITLIWGSGFSGGGRNVETCRRIWILNVLFYEYVYFFVGIFKEYWIPEWKRITKWPSNFFFFRIEVWAVLTTSPKSLRLRWFFHETDLEFPLPNSLFPQTVLKCLESTIFRRLEAGGCLLPNRHENHRQATSPVLPPFKTTCRSKLFVSLNSMKVTHYHQKMRIWNRVV